MQACMHTPTLSRGFMCIDQCMYVCLCFHRVDVSMFLMCVCMYLHKHKESSEDPNQSLFLCVSAHLLSVL